MRGPWSGPLGRNGIGLARIVDSAGVRGGSEVQRQLVKTAVLALALSAVAVLIWLVSASRISLSDAFFWVGAVPVLFGTIGSFGSYAGRGDATTQLSKTVLRESGAERAILEIEDLKMWQSSTWHWLGAGVALCVASFLLP